MMRIKLFAVALALLSATVLLPPCASAQAPGYSLTILGSLGGVAGSDALGMNSSGQVVGWSEATNGVQEAVEWSGTIPTVLTSLGGAINYATAINSSGQIVGFSSTPDGLIAAVEWSGTTVTILGSFGGPYNHAYGINDAGLVVGDAGTDGDAERYGVEWSGTTPTILSGQPASPNAINANGLIVGGANEPDGTLAAVEWTGTMSTILPSLGGGVSFAYGVNAGGQVVGYSYDQNNTSRAMEWINNTIIAIPTPNGDSGVAFGINDSGQIVGESDQSGFVSLDGTTYDLNSLIPLSSPVAVESANAINDAGQIAASGRTAHLNSVALLLDPISVPEPEMSVLMAAGILSLPLLRRLIRKG